MTNRYKNRVIAVLMCTTQRVDRPGVCETTHDVVRILCETEKIRKLAGRAWSKAAAETFDYDHGTICLDAAYRLIETSPALRRKWFGR